MYIKVLDMRLIGKIAAIFIVGVLLSASAYVIFYTGENNNNNNNNNNNQEEQDTQAPQITFVTGNITVTAGQTVTIVASFTDNVDVTTATLYYTTAGSTSWASVSIISGSVQIAIPVSATENSYYYVTVDDAAGNGPVGSPSVDGSIYYIITVIPYNGGDGGEENLTHTVFIEEATATWCSNCPAVANILHALYETHNYNFYYVALINDTNPIAMERNWKEYNVYGYPTVFVDGGFKVILGANNPESIYADAINTAQLRVGPKIKVTVTAQYENTTHKVTVNALVENKENNSYKGQLKLYLTEIVSHWSGYDSKPYQFAFLDYLLTQDISIAGKRNATYSQTTNISAYDYENLMIIAVVFNSEKHNAYSDPPTNKHSFNAYYADATNATKVVEKGNLPPQLQITSPEKGKIYLNGKPILERLQKRKILGHLLNMSLNNKTILLGQKLITVAASDDSSVAKVTFSIDGSLVWNDTQEPYEYDFTNYSKFKSIFLRQHVLTVTVYDDTGKTTSASLNFWARL